MVLTNLKTVQGSTVIRDLGYGFDGATGNLSWRTGMFGQKETFYYDQLDRLLSVKEGTPEVETMSMSYQPNGNIASKTGLGAYSYLSSKPHAVSSVENTGGLIPSTNQSISYTPFNKAMSLSETVGSDAYLLDIMYGPDQQRWKSVLNKNGSDVTTKVFAGDYEKITDNGITREFIYIDGGDGLAAVYVKEVNQPGKLYYAQTDHLGSIIALTDASGTAVFQANYDAWGKQTVTLNTIGFYRGFTCHEHLPEFGLINMNGRLYDPALGRFLSPDIVVQASYDTQSYNRYTYCMNNPLLYIDPSGYTWLSHFEGWIGENWQPIMTVAAATAICIGTDGFGSALIGAGSFGTGNLAVQAMNGNINNFGDIVGAFGQGAIAGYCLGAGIGAGLNVPILSTIIKGAAYLDAGVTALSAVKGLGQGIFTGDWSGLGNAGEIFLGNFALNDKLPGLGGAWEGISRFSWEGIQQTLGYSFNQCYNTFTHVDRVSYFDGATLVNRNGGGNEWGMTLGNFIMGNEMTANIDDETFMHEYGHTLQSQDYGPFYGLVIAPWSGLNMLFGGQRRIRKALSEHETEWYERQANGYAASYFGHYYNVSWEPYNYPIKKSDINQ